MSIEIYTPTEINNTTKRIGILASSSKRAREVMSIIDTVSTPNQSIRLISGLHDLRSGTYDEIIEHPSFSRLRKRDIILDHLKRHLKNSTVFKYYVSFKISVENTELNLRFR